MNKLPITQTDYAVLLEKVKKLKKERSEAGKEIGAACQQGAETFHDNAAYDAAMETYALMDKLFIDADRLVQSVVVTVPNPKVGGPVELGSVVGLIPSDEGEHIWYKVGSAWFDSNMYPVNDGHNEEEPILISFISPVARALLRKSEGDDVSFLLHDKQREFIISEILV